MADFCLSPPSALGRLLSVANGYFRPIIARKCRAKSSNARTFTVGFYLSNLQYPFRLGGSEKKGINPFFIRIKSNVRCGPRMRCAIIQDI
jgi:hypothetical protein